MRASLVALLLASLPCGALAEGVQEWRMCKAEDADHLVDRPLQQAWGGYSNLAGPLFK